MPSLGWGAAEFGLIISDDIESKSTGTAISARAMATKIAGRRWPSTGGDRRRELRVAERR